MPQYLKDDGQEMSVVPILPPEGPVTPETREDGIPFNSLTSEQHKE
jgi:hypothetical protein